MNRILAVLLVLAALGTLLAGFCRPGEKPRESATGPVLHDAPWGFVLAETLSIRKPRSFELAQDQRRKPYHLLVRVLSWPDLEPVVVEPPLSLLVNGGGEPERIGPGEFLYSEMALGLTRVVLRRFPEDFDLSELVARGNVPLSRVRPRIEAERNPVPLARHAVTICEVICVREDQRAAPFESRCRVYDLRTGEAVPGAELLIPDGTRRLADGDGFLNLDPPVSLDEFFSAVVHAEGYVAQPLARRALTGTWCRRLRDEGIAALTLRREGDVLEPAPVPVERMRKLQHRSSNAPR